MARLWQGRTHAAMAKTNSCIMMTLLLTLAGLFCFRLFFLATDYFEKV